MSSSLRTRADRVAEDLIGKFPQVSGVCLYGSVARGDAGPESDLDLLVVGEDPDLRPSSMRRALGLSDSKPRVSIVYHTPTTLHRYIETGSRFLLHVQLEGEVLYDDSGLLEDLKRRSPIQGPIRQEIEGQLRRLRLYEDPARYNGNFLFPLSHIFAIGKAILMAILSENEIYEFDRNRAFDAFIERFPDSDVDVETLRRLVPFYTLVSKGIEQELPFSYHHCDEEVSGAIAAVQRLADKSAWLST
jgi:predicted nucleotidyltransferase